MRIIPITLVVLLMSLGLRAYSIVTGNYRAGESVVVTSSIAAEETEEAEEEETEDEEHGDDEENGDDHDDEEAEVDEHGNKIAEDEKKEKEEEEEKYSPENLAKILENPEKFSQVEIDLLQSLAKRREELEDRNRQLGMREEILRATELKIDDKIGEMKDLKGILEELLTKYAGKEEAKIKSLVKIYENMKPKEAARIFNELEMDILLQVADLMAERKVAPILAKMSPKRAQEVTEELAQERRLPPIDTSVLEDE